MSRTLLSMRAYARRRGCSHVAVSKAVATGRLVEAVVQLPNGQRRVDADLADREWELNTDTRRQAPPPEAVEDAEVVEAVQALDAAQAAVTAARARRKGATPPQPQGKGAQQRAIFGVDAPPEVRGPDAALARRIKEAQAARVTLQARLDQLRVERMAGRLADLAQVQQEAGRLGRVVREALLAIPDRVAHELAATSDALETRRLLVAELETALRDLVDAQGAGS